MLITHKHFIKQLSLTKTLSLTPFAVSNIQSFYYWWHTSGNTRTRVASQLC